MYKRYIVEFGTGADLHGMDMTKAAKKAVKDAISHGCLCGLTEVLGFKGGDLPKRMKIQLKIAAPDPSKVDVDAVAATVPFGEVEAEVVQGGMGVRGLEVPSLGDGDTIVLVNAALTVLIDVD